MTRHITAYSLIILSFFSCSRKEKTAIPPVNGELTYRVESAPEWTALFKRNLGWFGSDGIFALPYTGVDNTGSSDSILFVFSDTMVGEIKDGTLQKGYTMVNNSISILKGNEPREEQARFLIARDEKGNPASVFVPKTPMSKPGEYYWLGDGLVNAKADSNFYIFAYRIRNTNTEETFPFREVGNALLVIPRKSKFPFADHRQLDIPFFTDETDTAYSSIGAGVLVNTTEAGVAHGDGYMYVYGVRGRNKELIASRVRPGEIENFSSWEFWNGKAWTSDIKTTAPIADSVSNELSVTPLPNNKYALVYQYASIYPEIYMQVGDSPIGPFGPREKLWDTRKDIQDPDLFTYNAKAHPAISKPGELLISYNVNSFKFLEVIEKNPNLYRPRFIRVVFEQKK